MGMRQSFNSIRNRLARRRRAPRPSQTGIRFRPHLELLESRLAPTVSILSNFAGQSGGGPPDTCGAAGPNSYVETINTSVAIYNKTTGALITPADDLNDFFFTVGGLSLTDSGSRLADATMVYDEVIGRFIVADMDINFTTHVGALDFAVSRTSNPTKLDGANWNFYKIGAENGFDTDYPGNLGYNADAFVYTFQQFNPPGGNLTGHTLVTAISQSDLAANGNIGGVQFDLSGFSYRPVTMHDSVAGGPMWLVQEGGGNNSINLVRVDNILNVNTISTTTFNRGVNAYSAVNPALNPDGSQITPTAGPNVNGANDTRILKAAEANNLIVACQNVGIGTTEDVARWYVFNVSDINNPTVANQGDYGFGNNTYTVYPSIDINPAGDIGLAFSKSGTDNSTDFVHADVVGMNSSDGGSMEGTAIIIGGGNTDINGREGDFSGISVDPTNGTFWAAQETSQGGTTTAIANWTMSNGGEAFVKNGVLVVTGTNADDNITLQPFTIFGLTFTQVVDNGVGLGAFFNGSFSSISVFGFGGNDSLTLTDTGGSKGLDFFNVPVAFDGGTGTNSVFLDDSTANFNDTYTITGNSVSRIVFGGLTYTNTQNITLKAETGNNIFNVFSTAAGTSVNIDGNGGADTINVGSGGSVQGIRGTLNLENAPSFNTINVNDSADGTARTITLGTFTPSGDSNFGFISGLAPANINYEYGDTSSVTIRTGNAGGNIVNILSTGTTTNVIGNAPFFGPNDTVNIGNGGSVQGIFGTVNLSNPPGFDIITVDDSQDGTARTTTITSSSVTGLAPAAITYVSGDTASLTVYTGNAGGNIVNILSTGTTTNLIGNAPEFGPDDTVNIGNGGSVQGILGTLNIENPPGFDIITVDDSADGTARTTTLGTFTPSGDSNFGFISGLAPANINYEYGDTSSVTVKTGNAGGNIVNILSTGTTTNVIGNAPEFGPDDIVNIGNAGSVQGILGTLNIENPPGFDIITVDDSADTTARTITLGTFTPSGDSNFGFISGLAPANINYEYDDTNSVTVNTGNVGGNVINVLATGVTTNLVGNAPFLATDTVNIGNAGSVQGILGTLNIENPPAFDTITVDDSADGTARTTTLGTFTPSGDSNFGFITGLAPANINYEYDDTNSVTVRTGNVDGNVINVLATGVTTNLVGNASATVNVGNGGSVQGILGTLNIENPPAFNTITVDDSTDGTARTVTLSTLGTNPADSEANADPWGQIGGLAPANINYEYFDTTSMTVNTGNVGGNVVNVQATGVTTILNANAATTYNIGSTANLLDNILATLTVDGLSGSTMNVNDQGSIGANTYTLTSGSVNRTGTATINYSGLANLVVNGSAGGSTYNINSTLSGTSYTFNGGAGDDTFNVGTPSQAFGNIQGALILNGGGGTNTITVNDQADAAADTYTITTGSIQRTGSAGVTYTSMAGVTVNGGSGAVTYNVNSIASGTPLGINAGTGANIVKLAGGNLDALAGAVTVSGGGASSIIVDDHSKSGTLTYTITSTTVSRSGFGGLTYSGLGALTLKGGTGADTYNIQGTALGTATTVTGGAASNTFNVGSSTGPTSVLDAILGALTINGSVGSSNVLNVSDQGNAAGQAFTLSPTVITRSGGVSITYGNMKSLVLTAGAGNDSLTVTANPTITTTVDLGGGSNTLTGPNAANTWTITSTNHGTLGTKLTFSNAQNLVGGTGADTFKFSGAGANITGNLSGGGGTADKLDYSADGSLAISVNLQTGVASRIGGAFSGISSLVGSTATSDTLTAANSVNAWSLTGVDAGKVNTFSFTGIENLVGGTNVDTFKFSFAGKETSIVGGGAPAGLGDWLDYSAFTAVQPVTVNLLLGTATNVSGSISGIENVISGAGTDTLTGDNNGNILIGHGGADTINGGTGRSLLIGGTGASTINGGSGGDILINGKTSYDTSNHTALMIILAEWRSADPYATRTDEITDGAIPGHLGIKLATGSTVTNNAAGGLLNAHAPFGGELDWFFAATAAQHSALDGAEIVNNDPA